MAPEAAIKDRNIVPDFVISGRQQRVAFLFAQYKASLQLPPSPPCSLQHIYIRMLTTAI